MNGPAGVVLTGGRSRRMGTDKALVAVDGRPMAVAVADALAEAGCDPVECQGGDLAGLGALGLGGHADEHADGGPVEAIRAASVRHGIPIVAAACDLPFLDTVSVASVIEAGQRRRRLAIATAAGRRHLVVYVPPGAEFAHRAMSVREWTEGAIEVPVDPAAVRNINAPDDLRRDHPGR